MRYQGVRIDFKDRSNWVAIIGSRKASQQENDIAYKMAQRCAKDGKIVISGLALGIDTSGHKGALENEGKTVAILSTSPEEIIYPKENQTLAEKIRNQGGLLFPYSISATSKEQRIHRLLERDILLALLCPTIIIAKATNSPITGGTKWATNYGILFNKKVYRLDETGKLHKNPDVEPVKANWEIELPLVKKQLSGNH